MSVSLSDTDTAQFSIHDRAGTVDVFADVYGYYVDHAHDDRYLLKDEIVTSHAPGCWVADTVVNPPLSFSYIPDRAKIDVAGSPPCRSSRPCRSGPLPMGPPTARRVCPPSFGGDAVVDEITLYGGDPSRAAFTSSADIATGGCSDFDLTSAGATGDSFSVSVEVTARSGFVMLGGVQVTWTPFTGVWGGAAGNGSSAVEQRHQIVDATVDVLVRADADRHRAECRRQPRVGGDGLE